MIFRSPYDREFEREQEIEHEAYQRGASNILDKIRDEIFCNIIEDDTSGNTPARLRADWNAANKAHMIDIAIIDKYKAEIEDK